MEYFYRLPGRIRLSLEPYKEVQLLAGYHPDGKDFLIQAADDSREPSRIAKLSQVTSRDCREQIRIHRIGQALREHVPALADANARQRVCRLDPDEVFRSRKKLAQGRGGSGAGQAAQGVRDRRLQDI